MKRLSIKDRFRRKKTNKNENPENPNEISLENAMKTESGSSSEQTADVKCVKESSFQGNSTSINIETKPVGKSRFYQVEDVEPDHCNKNSPEVKCKVGSSSPVCIPNGEGDTVDGLFPNRKLKVSIPNNIDKDATEKKETEKITSFEDFINGYQADRQELFLKGEENELGKSTEKNDNTDYTQEASIAMENTLVNVNNNDSNIPISKYADDEVDTSFGTNGDIVVGVKQNLIVAEQCDMHISENSTEKLHSSVNKKIKDVDLIKRNSSSTVESHILPNQVDLQDSSVNQINKDHSDDVSCKNNFSLRIICSNDELRTTEDELDNLDDPSMDVPPTKRTLSNVEIKEASKAASDGLLTDNTGTNLLDCNDSTLQMEKKNELTLDIFQKEESRNTDDGNEKVNAENHEGRITEEGLNHKVVDKENQYMMTNKEACGEPSIQKMARHHSLEEDNEPPDKDARKSIDIQTESSEDNNETQNGKIPKVMITESSEREICNEINEQSFPKKEPLKKTLTVESEDCELSSDDEESSKKSLTRTLTDESPDDSIKQNWKVGYLQVKLPARARGRGKFKVWHRRWVVVQPYTFGDSTNHSSVVISIYASDKVKKCNTLHWVTVAANRAIVYRSKSSSFLYSFSIADDTKPILHLAGNSETESQEWMAALRCILWPPSPMVQLEKVVLSDQHQFEVSILDDTFSCHAGLLGAYGYLAVTPKKLVLIHPQEHVIQEWYLNTIQSFKLEDATNVDKNKIVKMSTGRESSIGEGNIKFYSTEAVLLLQTVATTIHEVLENHSKATSKVAGPNYVEQLKELNEWMDPVIDGVQLRRKTEKEDYYAVPRRQVRSLLDNPIFSFDTKAIDAYLLSQSRDSGLDLLRSSSLTKSGNQPSMATAPLTPAPLLTKESGIRVTFNDELLNCSISSVNLRAKTDESESDSDSQYPLYEDIEE